MSSDRIAETIIRREFTWGEWCDTAKANLDSLPEYLRKGDSWQFGNADPLGDNYSADETIRIASTKGWQEAIPAADSLRMQLEQDMGESMRDDFVSLFDVAGSEVDMGRFLTGEPECMRESVPMKVMRTGRVIKLAVPICYPSTINADTVRARGAAVMALVNAFAMHQHPMEIHAVMAIHGTPSEGRGSRSGPKRLAYAIRVQEADQPLDMGRVMYALAHPTMLRQMAFAVEHGEDKQVQRTFRIGSGYGSPSYAAVIDDLNINVENAIILPPLMSNSGWSEQESLTWIREQMKMLEG